ncbi:MAG TPA: TM0106 family RecB-like putative nuclease [Candidatus Acidoferrum sp.]|nr:TM0106 family RecB-like putative nuclease [Candidatus Acidoferrum sp.]
MREGVDVIAQGALRDGRWFGRPDVLLKVPRPSRRRKWSYEVQDTKLSRETKAATILQLALYSDLLDKTQEMTPESFWVVPPGVNFTPEEHRVSDYAAYYRHVKGKLAGAVPGGLPLTEAEITKTPPASEGGNQYELVFAKGDDCGKPVTYPELVEHCKVCQWFRECDQRRHLDDHLSLVAGIRPQQRKQLEEWGINTMAKLAALPIPLNEKPKRGSREAIEHVREQARVQVNGRTDGRPVHDPILPVVEGIGFSRLPEPNRLDMFVDLEGDQFVGMRGQQYLFGFVVRDTNGQVVYEKRWTLTPSEEKHGFEWVMDEIMKRWTEEPGMHVYHYAANEPTVFKRLMGQYATREDEMDRMLRAGIFVDLHRVVKQGIWASVEEYSLKKMEAFYGFERKTALDQSRVAMRYIEHHLELGWKNETLTDEHREAMEGYNREDCESTARLRDWLEAEREKLIASGERVARPVAGNPEPPEDLSERQKRVAELVARLTKDLSVESEKRSEPEQAQWLLAQLVDWHRREDKASYWEKFRLNDLDEDELLEDKSGLGGLQFLTRLSFERKIPTDRYRFEKQETEAREGDDLYYKLEKFGTVTAIDFAQRTVDIKKTKKAAELHPIALYLWDRPYDVDDQKDAIFRIGEWVADSGMDSKGSYRAARDLMLRYAPRLEGNETVLPLTSETPEVSASRIARAMTETVFAIQGPPGAGKTYTGARMICRLVKQGKRIGVTALANKVIRKLLEEVVLAAQLDGVQGVRCMQKWKEGEQSSDIAAAETGDDALEALRTGIANVVGGTSFMWASESFYQAVDVLFIDEAGQMALADVISVAHAARNLVLIGDPRQLERPLKGSHPDGAEKSALEHLLGERRTILPEVGLLLPETWRLHPNICRFTSELFYEGRLKSREVLKGYVIGGHPWVKGAGLWYVPVVHEGNRNSSTEEVEAIEKIVRTLTKSGVRTFRGTESRQLESKDILIVAPYNAQVSDLSERLPGMKIGTVDKFQGQEAPVVIYSLTTSSPEDAPRGMEFLYSLNRLNVATSRAKTAVIVVGSPRLFEPECRTPRQMQLANALCAYREMATEVNVDEI